jgi:peptidyl-tRNA hydrolase
MTAGDVTVELVENVTTASLNTAITAMRNGASDKWLMTSINNGQDIIVVNIEED